MAFRTLNLKEENDAYAFGFLVCDGHIGKRRKNDLLISVEVCDRDRDVIEFLKTKIDGSIRERTRMTNFSDKITTSILRVANTKTCSGLVEMGFVVGKKDEKITQPTVEFDEIGFVRGIIDANGSLGVAKDGRPFISFCTKSEFLATFYSNFLERTLGVRKTVKRNSRDSVYNLMINNENSVKLAKILYETPGFALNRKREKFREMLTWIRTVPQRDKGLPWSEEEVEFLRANGQKATVEVFGRTTKSVQLKAFRLKNAKI